MHMYFYFLLLNDETWFLCDKILLHLPFMSITFSVLTSSCRLVQTMDYSVIVFDTAPTGHTLRLLQFPSTLEKGLAKMMSLKNKFGGLLNQVHHKNLPILVSPRFKELSALMWSSLVIIWNDALMIEHWSIRHVSNPEGSELPRLILWHFLNSLPISYKVESASNYHVNQLDSNYGWISGRALLMSW